MAAPNSPRPARAKTVEPKNNRLCTEDSPTERMQSRTDSKQTKENPGPPRWGLAASRAAEETRPTAVSAAPSPHRARGRRSDPGLEKGLSLGTSPSFIEPGSSACGQAVRSALLEGDGEGLQHAGRPAVRPEHRGGRAPDPGAPARSAPVPLPRKVRGGGGGAAEAGAGARGGAGGAGSSAGRAEAGLRAPAPPHLPLPGRLSGC